MTNGIELYILKVLYIKKYIFYIFIFIIHNEFNFSQKRLMIYFYKQKNVLCCYSID